MTSARALQQMNYIPRDEATGLLTHDGPPISARSVVIGRRPKFHTTDEGPVLQLNADTEVRMTSEDAAIDLLQFLKVPKSFAADTPANLLSPVLEERLARHRNVVVVTNEDGELVEIKGQDDLAPLIDPAQLLATIEAQFPEVVYQRAQTDDKGKANLLAITQTGETQLASLLVPGQHRFLPDGGDPFRSGVHLTFSTTGLSAPSIEPYIVRLVCLNGALHQEFLSQWGRGFGEGDDVWQWFRQGMEESSARTNAIMGRYAGMVSEIEGGGEGRMLAVEGAIRAARLPAGQATAIRDLALVDPPATHYDVWNLLTNAATHHSKNLGDQLTRMARAATLADPEMVHTWCPHCNRN